VFDRLRVLDPLRTKTGGNCVTRLARPVLLCALRSVRAGPAGMIE